MNPRLGILIHTQSTAESLACATLMDAVVIRGAGDLQPGTRALLELDLTAIEDAVAIGQQFRMHGVELIVTARSGTTIPYELARNLTGLAAVPL
jgi:hypothetical protein